MRFVNYCIPFLFTICTVSQLFWNRVCIYMSCRTCHPLSKFGMIWISVYDSVFQLLPICSNFAQPLKRSGPTFHRPQSTTWSTPCEGDVLHCVRQMVVTPDTDWFILVYTLDPPPNSITAHFRVAFYCGQSKAHLCNNHAVWSVSWYATPVRWMDYLGKGEVLTNTDLDRFVNNIWEK